MALPSPPGRRGPCARRPGAWATRTIGVIGALLVVLTVWMTGPPVAFGQAVDTAPPAVARPEPALLARVTPDPLDPPPIQVAGVWIAGDTVGAEAGVAAVSVVFDTAFELPREPWRVSVSVGDPLGERVRASLVSVGSAGVSGRVEQGDGVQWDDLGPTEVSALGDGLVTLRVPVGDAADDAVLWVEAEATVDAEIDVSRTPTFPLVDLLGDRPGPSLGTSPFAVVVDDPAADPLFVGVPGPTVQVVGRSLEVTTTAAAPTEAEGVSVVDVIDVVTLVEVGSEALTGRLEIDRRTGEVRLVTAGAEAFVAVPGATPWLVNPPSSTAPGAPATVTFDLEALNEAVGGPAFDRSGTRVGVSRILALDDRRIVDAAGVGGTMAWFDESLAAPAAPPPLSTTEDGIPLLALLLAGLVVLLGVAVVVISVLRRRANEPRPIDRLDPAPAPVAAGVVSFVPSSVPRLVGAASPPAPSEPEAAPTAMAVAPGEATGSMDPLAAFLAEVDELSARVDRLGGDGPGASGEAETGDDDEVLGVEARRESGPDRPR